MKLELLTLDELVEVKNAVYDEIANDLLNIADKNPSMNKYKGRFKKEFKLGCCTIKYNIEAEADDLNNEQSYPCIDYEGEIKIFKNNKEIQAFSVDEEIDE